MSLKQIDVRLIGDFCTAVAAGSTTPPTVAAEPSGTQAPTSAVPAGLMHHIGRDQYVCGGSIDSAGAGDTNGIFALDPFLTFTSAPNSLFLINSTGHGYILPGQFNPTTGEQKLYSDTVTSLSPEEVDIDTLLKSGVAAFTGPNGDFVLNSAHVTIGEGGWQHDNPRAGTLVFEGLTDGILNETVATGTNVYPLGLMLLGTSSVTGEVAGKDIDFNFVWVDPQSRLAVGVLAGDVIDNPSNPPQAFPMEVDSVPTNDSSEAPIGGDEFTWAVIQYIPDSDATFAQPKGLLMFQNSQEVPLISGATGGEQLTHYIRLADFNPFNLPSISTVPTRTHGRVRLTSRALIDVAPMGAVSGADTIANPTTPSAMQFDVLRQRFVAILNSDDIGGGIGANEGSVAIFYSLSVDPVIFSAPAARDVPRTNDIVSFETFVGGDLAEAVAGVEVAWTLTRRSTEAEVLNASTFPGSSTVANFPIDLDSAGAAILSIVADAVPLVLTTDYTVVASTGVITWVTDQSGAALVTATYEHRTTGATPAHGNLLTAVSETDENGNARTQVFYADDDDLVGLLDNLNSAAI